ncbi:unnamed protein product [Moneuplotes crassus]|uniref:Uncharacterized protein n=1 Tax=Euplotes crassus TaxID=5936 RepID=A0AAD1UH67_EUPCR|nr:unnamed protein product [Moneuplotes crassus]
MKSLAASLEVQDTEKKQHKSLFRLVLLVMMKAIPLLIASLGNAFSLTITMIFLARNTTDPYMYGAIGMGTMTMNMILRSYCHGFNNSLITHLSHAYGAKDYELMGIVLSKSRILWSILIIPFLVLLFFTRPLLLLLHQEELLAYHTGYYVQICMAGFVFHLHYDIYRKYLNSMSKFWTHVPVTYVSLIMHIGWCYVFIVRLKLELLGAALTVLIQFITNFVVIWALTMINIRSKNSNLVPTCKSEVFHDWGKLFLSGCPTYFLQLISFLSIESVVLITGFLEVKILVANTALINLLNILYLFIYAVMQSSSALIGNKIGEKDFAEGRRLIIAVMIFGILFSITISLILVMFSDWIFRLYVQDSDIIPVMYKIMPIFVCTLVCYIMKDISQTVIIGLGLQKKTVAFNILSFLLIGVPVSIYGLRWPYTGPWLGICLTLSLNSCYYMLLIFKSDIIRG